MTVQVAACVAVRVAVDVFLCLAAARDSSAHKLIADCVTAQVAACVAACVAVDVFLCLRAARSSSAHELIADRSSWFWCVVAVCVAECVVVCVAVCVAVCVTVVADRSL